MGVDRDSPLEGHGMSDTDDTELDRLWKGFVMTLSKEDVSVVSCEMASMRKVGYLQSDKVAAEYLMFVHTGGGLTLGLPKGVSWE